MRDKQYSVADTVSQLPLEALSRRKLPSTGADLVYNFDQHDSEHATEFFRPYSDYQLVNPDGASRDDLEFLEIPEDVLTDMFLSVTTNSGEFAYKGSPKVLKMYPGGFFRFQTYVFQDHLDAMGKDINQRYSGPTLIVDNVDNEIAIYIPPIVEVYSDGLVVIDGLHRSYIAHSQDEVLNIVVIESIVDPPAQIIGTVGDMTKKDVLKTYIPTGGVDSQDRPKFYDLNADLFRMFNYSGFGKFSKDTKRI